ncbi:peptide ABC transporter permease [Marinobacter sp. EhC06]|jgi:peptide/nickel transport system permease protein|uniref:ABC transporter permease n=2 Tax=Marinobacteraceae TaxID=2887365 RepID=UPI0007D8FEB7|nr:MULTISPECIES: ABC transporter permease [unclassified Marinobacter]OAN87164.1 peptide ABC transporter permease [Marinobacter sp. EhN04]OAN89463.1 peptide ABC transporter permease [Marinobacter sp. EhC06]PHS47509.1 MAG: ABC transporter permease [Marinobacter sp.]
MPRFVVMRLLQMIPVMLGVSFVVFISVYLVPGDVARTVLGQQASDTAVQALREELGLNRPLLVQYGIWLWDLLQFDLGYSISQRVEVASLLGEKIVNSFILMGFSLFLVITVSFLLAVFSATHFRSIGDRLTIFGTLLLASAPTFWLGILLLYLFSVKFPLFPTSGMQNFYDPGGFWELVHHATLPAIATAASSIAIVTRVSRSAMIDVTNKTYMMALRSRGIRRRRLNYVHMVRNALPSFVNISGLQVGYLFGSAIFSEIIFNWPGIGLQLYNAILQRDVPMIQGCSLVIALTFVISNFLADFIVRALDASER